ncbi:hypothetical protein JXR93_13720 [bacterium]|nr:hypothetical protein [bacterium]
MERLQLHQKNGILYFEKGGKNYLLSYFMPISLFSSSYVNIQINNKPIIKKEQKFADVIEKSLGENNPIFKMMPKEAKDLIQQIADNPSILKDMAKDFGFDESILGKFGTEPIKTDELFEHAFDLFQNKTGLKFTALLGRDVLEQFITLFEFDKNEITFFTDRFEVGEAIGNRYNIMNLEKDNMIWYVPSFISIGDKSYSLCFDTNTNNYYMKKSVFESILGSQKSLPESKMFLDFFNELGSLNMTLFKVPAKRFENDESIWVGELPDIKSSLFEHFDFLDGMFPLCYLGKNVLVDGVHSKFGIQK